MIDDMEQKETKYKLKANYFTKEQILKLKEISYKEGISQSEIIRQALDGYLKQKGT